MLVPFLSMECSEKLKIEKSRKNGCSYSEMFPLLVKRGKPQDTAFQKESSQLFLGKECCFNCFGVGLSITNLFINFFKIITTKHPKKNSMLL